jgi:uncharacterized protein
MIDQLAQIITFIIEAFIHLAPYLLLSIPLAVLVRVSNASQYIQKAFHAKPLLAIILATLVGAFSPFCACTVVPLIASLLIAGVPLGPVMAFWIASPTMDPEIFLLSVGILGYELAVVRVIATLILSMTAGYSAHFLEQRHFFSDGILRKQKRKANWSWKRLVTPIVRSLRLAQPTPTTSAPLGFVSLDAIGVTPSGAIALESSAVTENSCESSCGCGDTATPSSLTEDTCDTGCGCGDNTAEPTLWERVRVETISATVMIVKFMFIAFLLEALIMLYIPQTAIIGVLGEGNPIAILFASLVGVPIYTTNLTALPLVGGLMAQGMLPGAALAFLIAGPTTTIPAMSAVFGIAKPRVFALYVSIALIGSIVLGYGYQIILSL